MAEIIVNGHKISWKEGMTVQDVLDAMKYTFKLIIVKVNGELVKREMYGSYSVPDNADVEVNHLISGG
ncbi:MAG TPA: sulfur carrier protein ThiS [Clostridiales bacterium]|nr:sulfur carrier protein ThiS [Clostridiales bacterium]HQP70751.1 sulfur carrier protein ThiS [Clostridiales bacterium]